MISLLLPRDVEENSGPTNQEMLKEILESQASSEAQIDALRTDMTKVNATSEETNTVLDDIQNERKSTKFKISRSTTRG